MDENKLKSYWKQVERIGRVERLDDDAMLALGSIFGKMKAEIQRLVKLEESVCKLIPIEEWHEDDGNVIWWKEPINEPPYVGTSLDSEFEENYYTHFTRLIEPSDTDD